MRFFYNYALGRGRSRIQCFNVTIIPDITYEGNEEFQVFIRPNEQATHNLYVTRHTANVTIIDYNGEYLKLDVH